MMRVILPLCIALAALGFAHPLPAQNSPSDVPLARNLPPLSQPVVEVAAFRVAPVAAADTNNRSRGKLPGNPMLAGSSVNGSERETELRTRKGERWPDVLARIASALAVMLPASAVQTREDRLPALLPGKYLRTTVRAGGVLRIEYVLSADEAYAIQFDDAAFQVHRVAADTQLIGRVRADPAKASLFTAADAIGLPEAIALQLTEIFAGEVDFLRELHLGYQCAIVYEAHYREGFIEPSGRILAVELDVGKRQYRAYFAPDTQGNNAYFDGSGKNTRRVFRRSPLAFTRITSDYTLARFHPILGIWTAHRGVDYAAPVGTPIATVADGVVESVGARGGYGNLVVVRHQDRFLTYYAHMSAFAPQLAVGSKVAKGETLGFVGMTGLATGPHLHFEFHVRAPSGEWTPIPAPDVIEATITAAPGFADKVHDYQQKLMLARRINSLILE